MVTKIVSTPWKQGHCYSDLCNKPLPSNYVVCPHCNESAKRSMCGYEIAYCNEECRLKHWKASHHLECSHVVKEAERRDKLKNASEAVLQKLREENSRIPVTLGITFCDGCRQRKNEELKTCKKCRTSLYCSRDCQVRDWEQHKKNCKKPFTAGWHSPLVRCVLGGDMQGLTKTIEYIKDNNLSSQHVNYQDEKGGNQSPLYLAVEHHQSRLPMIPILLEAGADVHQVFRGYTPLMECMFPLPDRNEELTIATAKLLLRAGANVNQCDFRGFSPLITAARKDRPELVRVLLEAGANVNHQSDTGGVTALYCCAQEGSIKSMTVLHEYQADPSIRISDGRSPVFVAFHNGHLECARYLVKEMGADASSLQNEAG